MVLEWGGGESGCVRGKKGIQLIGPFDLGLASESIRRSRVEYRQAPGLE